MRQPAQATSKNFKPLILAGVLYITFFAAIFGLEKTVPSGPCTPGPSIFLFMLFPFIATGAAIVRIWRGIRGAPVNFWLAGIHALAFIIWLTWISFA